MLVGLLLGIFFLDLVLGSVRIPARDIFTVLLGGEAARPAWKQIILLFRLPRALTAILAGAALAASGLQMQTLFRNPLAGPFVLGINAGASLGVALVVLTVGSVGAASLLASMGLFGDFGVVVAATVGAASVLAAVLFVSKRVQSSTTILILGLMFGYATGALVSILLYFSIAERIQAYIVWTFGSFSGVTWSQLRILAPAVFTGLLIAQMLAKPLNALLLGEAYAQSMGVMVKRARLWIITSASILAGAITAFCGPIAFLGVAVPHLCRALFQTSDHRTLVPVSVLMGATLALLADLVSQMPGSQTVLPLNAVTSLIGAPVVTWVILRQGNFAGRRRVSSPALSATQAQFDLTSEALSADTPAELLTTRELAIGYAAKKALSRVVAENISVSLSRGAFVCLIGPNGAGKSTLLRTLVGMQKPLSGSVLLKGNDVHHLKPSELARHLSVVLTERVEVGNLSAEALVAMGRYPYTDWTGRLTPHDKAVVQWAIRAVGAEALAPRHINELSDGERQRVMVARALAQEPTLIVLDEPTAFLDLPRRVEMMALLRHLAQTTGRVILLSTHDLDLALRSADQIWLFPTGGPLHVGLPEDLVLNGAFEKAFHGEGVVFDANTGAFKVGVSTWGRVALIGEGRLALWTRRALERIGLSVVHKDDTADMQLEATSRNGEQHWRLTIDGQTSEYEALAELVSFLRQTGQEVEKGEGTKQQ